MSAGVMSAPGGLPSVEFHGPYTDATSGTAKRTFSSVPFGNPSADRAMYIVVAFNAPSSSPMTVTVGGNSASRVSFAIRGNTNLQIYRYEDYSAEDYSGDIEITPAVATNGMIMGLYAISRQDKLVTNFSVYGIYPATTGTIDFEQNGLVFGGVASLNATGTGEFGMDIHDVVDIDSYLSGNGGLALVFGRTNPSTTESSKAINADTVTGTSYCWLARSIKTD